MTTILRFASLTAVLVSIGLLIFTRNNRTVSNLLNAVQVSKMRTLLEDTASVSLNSTNSTISISPNNETQLPLSVNNSAVFMSTQNISATFNRSTTSKPSLGVMDDLFAAPAQGVIASLWNNASNSSLLPTAPPSIAFVGIIAESPQSSTTESNSVISTPTVGLTSINSTLPSANTSVHVMDLPHAKSLAENLLSLIHNRYELSTPVGSQFWHTTNNMGKDIWDIIKYKIAKKAVDKNQDFLMVFGGSSVTAGHDSYFHQSYPMILKKRMEPIFASLGINLVVHNIAQGANNCNPYDLCYESMGGHDPDWVGWEQSYNCGHEEAMFELSARWAGWSKNRGVIYFSASGAWSPGSCPSSTDPVPYCEEKWTEESAGLKKWIPSENDIAAEKALLDAYYAARPSAARFIGSWHNTKGYNGIGPHGFNVWEGNPKCETVKDGKPSTGCNGIDAAQGCKLKFMTKEASKYGLGSGAAHHPTRAFHMLRGEAIAWLYTLAALDAVYMLETDLKTATPIELSSRYLKKLDVLQPPMPEPVRCKGYHCEKKMNCYTNYQPHYSPDMTINALVIGKTNWTEPEEEGPRKEGHLDFKPFFDGIDSNKGEINLRITIGDADYVWLFGNMKNAEVYLDRDAAKNLVGLNATYTPSPLRVRWTTITPQGKGPDALHVSGLPQGKHVLSVSKATLTHVITWP